MQARATVPASDPTPVPTRARHRGWARSGWVGPVADLAALLVFALLPQLFFWRLLTGRPSDQMTIVEGDFTQEYFPVVVTAARSLADGALPLWNPLSNGGQPLLADPQAALLYPLTWLALAGISGFDGASLLAMERLVPLHFGLTGVFSYLMGRVLLGSRVGAAVAALVFAFSGYLTSFPVQQLPILRAVTWFPLQVLFLWLAVQRASARWTLAGGLAFGIAILAGHPQTAFLEAVGLAVCVAVWTYQRGTATHAWTGRPILSLAIMLAVGAGLSAVQWLPSLEFMRLSSRANVGYDYLSDGFTLWEVPLDVLAPRVLGGLPPYVGLLPLVLAGVGVWARRHALAGAAVALSVSGLLLSLGGHTFLYPLLYSIAPGFDLFRHQERAIFLFTFGLALLAGLGAAVVCGRVSRRERFRIAQTLRVGASTLVGLMALSLAVYVGQLSAEVSGQGVQRWREMVHWLSFAVLMLGLGLCIVTARTRLRSLRWATPGLLLALIGLDLWTVSWDVNLQRRAPDDVYRASEIVQHLQTRGGLARVDDRGVLNGNHGLVYGVPTVTQSFVLHLARIEEAGARLPLGRLYDLLNVEFVVTREPRSEFGEVLLREQFSDVTNLLYKRSSPGAAMVVPSARAVSSSQEAWDIVAEDDFDLRKLVVIETAGTTALLRGGDGLVTRYERRWDRVEVSAVAANGGYLVVSEIYYPGWQTKLDGAPAETLRANGLLRAVWLPPGEHEIVMTFEPVSVRLGVLVSVLTAFIAIAWVLLSSGRLAGRRRARSGEGEQQPRSRAGSG